MNLSDAGGKSLFTLIYGSFLHYSIQIGRAFLSREHHEFSHSNVLPLLGYERALFESQGFLYAIARVLFAFAIGYGG